MTPSSTPLEYAPWRATALGAITERLERAVVLDLVGPLAGRDVLDVGCGDGSYALAAARAGGVSPGSPGALRSLARGAGLVPGCMRAAAFYPPVGVAARVLEPVDLHLGRVTCLGAAFIAVAARRPAFPTEDGLVQGRELHAPGRDRDPSKTSASSPRHP